MAIHLTNRSLIHAAVLVAVVTACSDTATAPGDDLLSADRGRLDKRTTVQCDPDNGGITLPRGFCAVVVADQLGPARHMAITPSGDIFVAMNESRFQSPWPPVPPFGIVALRDVDGDGRADVREQFNPGKGGSGIAWGDGRLYFGENDRVLRYPIPDGQLLPTGAPEVVVGGLPSTGDHISKTVVLNDRTLFVNIGSASNSCQVANRQAQSPGKFPCDELPIRAGVWTFDALGTNQTQANGQQYATGLRNMVALDLNPRDGELYGVQHGRDMLFENWPQFFTVEEDAVLPSEEFIRIARGSDNGWPYCYFDAVFEHRKVLAPEYGGNGQIVSGGPHGIDCSSYNEPLVNFGAHWAPNGLHFYEGKQFPGRYRGGAFIAFHGGFDRAPLPNEGYKVMFVPMRGSNQHAGRPEVFADNFAQSSGPLPATARHRPVGVTEGPDGSLYISDDRGGRIWRVIWTGK